jgi:hypothetical protein
LITGPRSSADAYGEREVTAVGSVIGRSGKWGAAATAASQTYGVEVTNGRMAGIENPCR